jgi:hypothetical protein
MEFKGPEALGAGWVEGYGSKLGRRFGARRLEDSSESNGLRVSGSLMGRRLWAGARTAFWGRGLADSSESESLKAPGCSMGRGSRFEARRALRISTAGRLFWVQRLNSLGAPNGSKPG